jgi:hypothetical protein
MIERYWSKSERSRKCKDQKENRTGKDPRKAELAKKKGY